VEKTYTAWCSNKHLTRLSLDRLDDTLSDGNCPNCSGRIERTNPESISVICLDCRTEHTGTWTEMLGFFHEACPTCSANLAVGGRFHVVGSTPHEVSDYEEMHVREEAEAELRPARADYWEYVIHFCTPKQFEGILKANTIFAAETGYFKKPAVCLTDAPLAFTPEIEKAHGSCGFMFRKSVILKAGGGPAVYLSPSVLKAQKEGGGFSKTLMPFVNIVRPQNMASPYLKKYDWLHEREWRFPLDIPFDQMPPEAVVLPPGKKEERFCGFKSPKAVIAAARLFSELRRPG
jgi:hypothetical protein